MELETQKLLEKQKAETEAQKLLQQQQAEAEMKQFIRQQQAEAQQLMQQQTVNNPLFDDLLKYYSNLWMKVFFIIASVLQCQIFISWLCS